MRRRVTIQDIAHAVGVSKSTVSRALNDNPKISLETRLKIQQVARKMNYVPNHLARGLTQGSTKTVGLVVLDIMNPFFAEFARGAENYLLKHEYTLILCNSDGDIKREISQIEMLIEKRVSGLILAVVDPEQEHFTRLCEESIPMVLLDRYEKNNDVSYVTVDGVVGGRLATDYLASIGHRRIGHIAGPKTMAAHYYRLKGYQAALRDHSIPYDPSLVRAVREHSREESYRVMNEFLAMSPELRPTAVFAFNDILALGAYKAILDAGLCIPEDISLVGYDDIELSSLLPVPLTTIHQPTYDQGKLAAMILLELLSSKTSPKPRRVVLEPTIVIRESTRELK